MTEGKRPPASPPARAKKSETLEVRIPYETKQAFLTACREDGTTASEVVRESVHTYLDGRERPTPQRTRTLVMKLPQPVRRYGPRIAAGAVAAIGLATFVALPSAAAPDFQAAFKRLDVNGDGVLTAEEFAGPKTDSDDSKNVVIETRTRHVTKDGKDTASPPPASGKAEIKQEAFSFWLPDELSKDGVQEQHEYKFVSQREVRIQSDDKSGGAGAVPTPPDPPSMADIRKGEFDTFDKDRDGKVNYAEFLGRQRAMLTRGFEMLDANNDKSLSADEYAKIVSPPMIKLSPDDPDVPEVTIKGGPKISAEAIKATFTKLDVNKDKKLSLQEYLPPA